MLITFLSEPVRCWFVLSSDWLYYEAMNKHKKGKGVIQIEHTLSAWGSALSQLALASDLTEEQVAEVAHKGGVWRKKHNAHKMRRVRDPSAGSTVSDRFYLNYDRKILAQIPLVPTLVSDQLNYSVWNKPSGMLSQGSKWSDHCTITETVRNQHGKPTFLVHRLDKAASGLMVVAHTKNALKKLAELFNARLVEKHYTLLVNGEFNSTVPHRLDMPVEGKEAITDVLEVQYNAAKDTSTLLVSIGTGRKHQIRDHLHAIGLPVVGDRLFDPGREHSQDLQLKACALGFECPFTNEKRLFRL